MNINKSNLIECKQIIILFLKSTSIIFFNYLITFFLQHIDDNKLCFISNTIYYKNNNIFDSDSDSDSVSSTDSDVDNQDETNLLNGCKCSILDTCTCHNLNVMPVVTKKMYKSEYTIIKDLFKLQNTKYEKQSINSITHKYNIKNAFLFNINDIEIYQFTKKIIILNSLYNRINTSIIKEFNNEYRYLYINYENANDISHKVEMKYENSPSLNSSSECDIYDNKQYFIKIIDLYDNYEVSLDKKLLFNNINLNYGKVYI